MRRSIPASKAAEPGPTTAPNASDSPTGPKDVPGLYLLAILVSAGFIVLLDARFTLAFWRSPGRAAAAVGTATAFLLAWDLAGIAAGVFVKGDSPLYLGWDLAPHLPLEEIFFLLFLAYLALVV